MGDGFTTEKKKEFFLAKKPCFFLLRANFPVTLQNLNSYSLVSEKCGQLLVLSEEFPPSDTDSTQIYCFMGVMGNRPQTRLSLRWNNRSRIMIICYFAIKWLLLQVFGRLAEYFPQMLGRRHHYNLISVSESRCNCQEKHIH